MREILNENIQKIKTVNLTNHKLPVIISIPHSGIYLSKSMYDNLVDNIVLPNMDWYLPKFYEFLEEFGFTIIINNVSRYVIDPNRSINEENKNGTYKENYIYTKTTFGKKMYRTEPNYNEIEDRIKEFYNPYHQTIVKAINDKLKYFKKVYLIDLHSFGKDILGDIVLGNDNNKTTSYSFIQNTKKLLEQEGFIVKNNIPYSGGYITKYYGNQVKNCEALQLELWYNSYINKREFGEEELPEINEALFKETQQKMKNFFRNLTKELLKEE